MKFFKKLLSVSCLLVAVLSLVACGASDKESYEIDDAAVYATVRGVVSVYDSVRPESYEQITAFTEEELDQVTGMLAQQGLNISSDAFINGFTSYKTSLEDLGQITDISDLTEVSEKNGKITAHVTATGNQARPDGTPRTADIEVIMSRSLKVESAAFNVVQTTGEKLSHAGLNTLLGMGTTFTILILISIVIYLLSFVPKIMDGSKKEKNTSTEAVDKTIGQIIAKEEEARTDARSNDELIAVISAAIAAYESSATGKPVTPDTFIVRSLKKH